ncbi:Putative ABC transporter, periplasmic solute-binding protein (fragment) [Nostocoides japonicum T1-X7]|uniref:Putative ABC transporter, periplasmic solute-binding protein n=1 Tax=Nostocoides japonicum T1-X7 TaxID=1194083 RepID=A0A077LTP5_9MICO
MHAARSRHSARVRVGALVAVAATLVSAGCAKGGGTSASSSTDAQADSGKEISAISVALPGSLSSLYPGQESGILNYNIANLFYEGLVGLNGQGRIVPALAEKWSQPNATTYVYDLRANAKFSDGSPVTAQDVKFSLDEARDAKTSPGIAGYLSGVKDVAVTGDRQVTVTLKQADAAFPTLMSTAGAAFITSEKFWKKVGGKIGTSTSLVLGTGPYKVTSFTPDSGITLERDDTWWGTAPKVKTINVKFIADENTRLLAAKSGDVDIAFNVPLDQVAQWKQISGERVEAVNDLSYLGLNFDTRVKPFDDPKVREAIAYAADKDAYVTKLLHGYGEVATSMMTPESLESVYSASEARQVLNGVTHTSFDLTKAKAALAASTHPQGFSAELTYPNTGPQIGLAAQALAQSVKSLGITLTVKEVPIEQWLATLGDKTHGVSFMWYFSTTGDPAEVPSYMLGAGNISGYDNPAVTSLLTQAAAATDGKTRIADLVKADSLQAADYINVPLWWGQSVTGFSAKVALKDFRAFTFNSEWGSSLYAPK